MVDVILGTGNDNFVYSRSGRNNETTILDFGSIYFSTFLGGFLENPPTGSPASGNGSFALNRLRTQLNMDVSLNGIDLDGLRTPDPGDDVEGFHFHRGAPGVNGGIVWGAIGPDNDVNNDTVIDGPGNGLTSVWNAGEGNGTTLTAQVASLLAGNIYLNVHSEDFPGGEIRGQLRAVDQGRDRIDLTQVNIGEFGTLLKSMVNFQGDATIATRFRGDVFILRLDGASIRNLTPADFIFAGAANQTIEGSPFADDLFAAGGNDTVNAGIANDRVFGESGNDVLDGQGGKDTIEGGSGADTVNGGVGNDLIGGNADNDSLSGFSGSDRIFGGPGSDNFNGGSGRDGYVGGPDADFFSFTAATWGGDTVADFLDGVDKLRFKKFIADSAADFAITGNGTAHVVLAIGAQTVTLNGAAPIFINNADFLFLN